MRQHPWRPQMTDAERKRGWVFFALYLLVFPYLNALVQQLALNDAEAPVAESNVVYYAVLFLLALAVFWTFLRHGFSMLVDWLPENAFAFATGAMGTFVLSFLLTLLPLPVEDPSRLQYLQEYTISPTATLVLLLALIPFIEETLFRGLVFGSIRQRSRPLAYAVTVLGYALSCVWRYALEAGDPAYLLLAVRYLPMSLALTWCYDNGGSIWAAIALHAAINGMTLMSILH